MTPEQNDEPIFDAIIRVDGLPAVGCDLDVALSAAELQGLTDLLEVSAVERLTANLHAVPFRGGIRVTGRVAGRVVQPCVVTLEPVSQDIDEAVDRVFLPASAGVTNGHSEAEIFVDPEGEDLPDVFDGREADLSGMIIETLALAIDPYPRAPGVSVADLGIEDEDEEASPFAVLKGLRGPEDQA